MTLIKIRTFKDNGIDEFRKLLLAEKLLDPTARSQFPQHLISNAALSDEHPSGLEIDTDQKFATSKELGEYFHTVLGGHVTYTDIGIWSWLANVYMDVIAPIPKPIGSLERYIPAESLGDPRSGQKIHRHLIRGPFDVVSKSKSAELDSDFADLLLAKHPNQIGSFFEICYSNIKIKRNTLMQLTAAKLYSNGKGGMTKGFDNRVDKNNPTSQKGKGGLRRFAKYIVPRVQENFDLEIMKPDDFVEAWGDEVKNSAFWKNAP